MLKNISIKLLTVIAVFYCGTLQAQVSEKPIPIKYDSISKLLVPIDSIETLGNLKFKIFKKNVHASYYADRFTGKRTASGKKFDNKKYTAAHRKLPFGTKLRITNESNGECVIVEITDRGPFSKGREIDLSKKAFMDIAHNKRSGGMNVTIEIIQ